MIQTFTSLFKNKEIRTKIFFTLAMLLSLIHIFDALKFDAIKTKEFVKVMDAFKFEGKTLFVADIAEDFDNAFMSLRNIPNAALLTVEELNAFDIANAAKLVMTEAAANKAGEVFA